MNHRTPHLVNERKIALLLWGRDIAYFKGYLDTNIVGSGVLKIEPS
ncbi:hypothetical protein NKT34_16500 [Paenibacillus polysaccharolyticus]|nr:hypothetical protein [Paenibacillus polysaccharolyticus]MCP1134903.1 hypothetical protein [Paenibacillus polysaccharolyticus]